jgi:hypothetical protein
LVLLRLKEVSAAVDVSGTEIGNHHPQRISWLCSTDLTALGGRSLISGMQRLDDYWEPVRLRAGRVLCGPALGDFPMSRGGGLMNRLLMCMAAAILAMAGDGLVANAQLPIVFDESVFPNNPENGFGGFTFDDFSGPGAFTDGPTSLILDVQDSNASNGVFGGAGVDYGLVPGTTNRDFNPATSEWALRLKILPNNTATAVRTTYIDHDGGFPVAAQEYVFEWDLTTVPNDGQFYEFVKPMTAPLFDQTAFGFAAGNGVQDPGLRQMQIQSVFGSTGRLNIEVDYSIIRAVVPEPTSLLLVGLACTALVFGRKRVA